MLGTSEVQEPGISLSDGSGYGCRGNWALKLLAFLSRADAHGGKGRGTGSKASAALWRSALSSPCTLSAPAERQREGGISSLDSLALLPCTSSQTSRQFFRDEDDLQHKTITLLPDNLATSWAETQT